MVYFSYLPSTPELLPQRHPFTHSSTMSFPLIFRFRAAIPPVWARDNDKHEQATIKTTQLSCSTIRDSIEREPCDWQTHRLMLLMSLAISVQRTTAATSSAVLYGISPTQTAAGDRSTALWMYRPSVQCDKVKKLSRQNNEVKRTGGLIVLTITNFLVYVRIWLFPTFQWFQLLISDI